MNKNQLEMVLKGNIEGKELTETEKELALKILNDLEGTLVIRANSILEFCIKAIKYTKI